MNKNIRLVLTVVLVTFVALISSISMASALDRPSIVVTVDHARIERELGACESGRQVWVHMGHRSERIVESRTSIPMSYNPADSLSISVEMNCGDRDEALPSGTVDIAFN